ncbi:MAG: hypothetical protein N2319_07180 [Candidatus Kapabacteria bacterium]|nr:hypothetical protein [Candidatus Kapabacteria bacterium]
MQQKNFLWNLNSKINFFIIISFGLFFLSCSGKIEKQENGKFTELIKKSERQKELFDSSKFKGRALDLVIKGSNYQQAYRFAEAILEFQEALRFDNSPTIHYAISKCYYELGKLDLAEEYCLNALMMKENFLEALELLGEIYLAQYNYEGAVSAFEKLNELNPTKTNIITLARLYEIKDQQKAIDLYEKIIQEGDDIVILRRLSDLYKNTDQKEKHLEIVKKIYSYTSSNLYSILDLIDTFVGYRKFSELIQIFDDLNNKLPESDQESIYNYYGNILLDDTSADIEKPIKEFLDKLGNRFYLSWKIQYIKGFLAAKVKDSTQAEIILKRSLNLVDTIPQVPISVGFFFVQRNKNDEAYKIFKEASNQFSSDARFPYFASLALKNLKKDYEAIEYARKAYYLEPNDIEYSIHLGMLYDNTKQYDSCDYFYEKALEIDELNPLVNNNYAYSLSVRGKNLEKALEMINIALTAEPENASFLDTYGWIQFKLGNTDKAIEYIKKAIKIGDVSAEVFEHLGDIYNTLGDKIEAEKNWRKGLEIEPDNSNLKIRLNID